MGALSGFLQRPFYGPPAGGVCAPLFSHENTLGLNNVADGTQISEDVSRSRKRGARCAVWSGYHDGAGGHRRTAAESGPRGVRPYPADRGLIDNPDPVNSGNVREGLDRLLPRLWRFCLVLSGDRSAADDLVQAACLRALEREKQFEVGTRLDHWYSALLIRSGSISSAQRRSDAAAASCRRRMPVSLILTPSRICISLKCSQRSWRCRSRSEWRCSWFTSRAIRTRKQPNISTYRLVPR